MDDALKALAKQKPWLFWEAYRSCIFAQKDMGGTQLVYVPSRDKIVATDAGTRPGHEEGSGGSVPSASLFSHLRPALKQRIIEDLDRECRMNQFVFHGKYFIIDAILKVMNNHQKSITAADVIKLRQKCLGWHDDWQQKFLWKEGLYIWCKSYAASNRDVVEASLTLRDDYVDEADKVDAKSIIKEKLKAQLTKPTFDAAMKPLADIVDFIRSGLGDPTTLAHAWWQIEMNTLVPLMLCYIESEKSPRGRDENIRKDLVKTYQKLAFESRFEHVDKDIFIWSEKAVKRRKTGKSINFPS
jgi:hypothetical protein